MPRLTIDNQTIDVPDGTTLLAAAARLGIAIPTLCHMAGQAPLTTCFLCVVKVEGRDNLLPACATAAMEGMNVQTACLEVIAARKTCLELMFSDHAGDCIGPCQQACPAGMDIPAMLRQIADGDLRQAVVTAKSRLVLPATLGRICPAPCEKACRRAKADGAVGIRMTHCYAGAHDLAADRRFVPALQSPTGKHVAIVGAGPAGLSSAFFLLQDGHACTLFDERDVGGGRLREIDAHTLPGDILDGEIDVIVRMGLELRPGVRVGRDVAIQKLLADFNAVVLATGQFDAPFAQDLGLDATAHGLTVDRITHATSMARVFAAGGVVSPRKVAVRSVADGHAAAVCVDQFLRGRPIVGWAKPFSCHIGHMLEGELDAFMAQASPAPRQEPTGNSACGCVQSQAQAEALRCLHCDCRKADDCDLRCYGQELGVNPHRFRGGRRHFEQELRHAAVIYESGKCIACGRCVAIAATSGEGLGLAFVGRGFTSRVRVPFDEPLSAGLRKVADEIVRQCPTGAMALKEARGKRQEARG